MAFSAFAAAADFSAGAVDAECTIVPCAVIPSFFPSLPIATDADASPLSTRTRTDAAAT
jgi:hypothetical protein